MAVLTIDGIKIEAPEGKNALDCALENGIYIPHLCHHPDLPPGESCRLCVVEVEGEAHPLPSCTLAARDGLVIQTKSDRLSGLRALALELLLAGHPEDCTTCPKYGDCELQTLIQYIGPSMHRMRVRNKGFRKSDADPLLEHEMNRCVLCGRCVRACNNLRSVGVLQYRKKESEFLIGPEGGKSLAEAGCRFCGTCAELCPTGTIRDKQRPVEATWNREDIAVPCRATCPAGIDIPRYIRLVKEGAYDAAAAVIREKVPFPMILGNICNHECESSCKRGDVNDPISIKNLKRIAAERDTGAVWKANGKQLADTGKRVCVVGAGPAGMTAAYYLRKQGHTVTVKEALPAAGGMMRFGIPAYRLPSPVIEEELRVITDTGVTLETGARVERPAELLDAYDAVLLALGTHKGVGLPLPGADLDGVLLGTDFLRQARLERETGLGQRVVVLGGGNVAFDCARTAIRLGAAEVHLACLEARESMPADDEEIEQAMEEGVRVHPARSFEEITGDSHVTGVALTEVESFTMENGRANVVKRPGSDQQIVADTVIFAVGQRTGLDDGAGVPLAGPGRIALARDGGLATEVEGLFAAGDMVYGTKSVVQAIASGRQAAEEIDRYLGGDGDIAEQLAPTEQAPAAIGPLDGFAQLPRTAPLMAGAQERVRSFAPIDLGLDQETACREAERCLQCDLRLRLQRPRLWADYASQKEGH